MGEGRTDWPAIRVRVERKYACVVLHDPGPAGADTETAQPADCREQLNKWSGPRTIRFHAELPTTRVRQIDYRSLREQWLSTGADAP